MNTRFELAGPLTELSSYPQWTQEMVGDCDRVKQTVIDHDLWEMMKEGTLSLAGTTNFMIGIWPVIERFPGYMARSLLKTQYGRSAGDDIARRWLVRNIRVEQNHAEYWLHWAEGAGVPREEVLKGTVTARNQTSWPLVRGSQQATTPWPRAWSRPTTPWRAPPASGRSVSTRAVCMPRGFAEGQGPAACAGFSCMRPMTIPILGRRWKLYVR